MTTKVYVNVDDATGYKLAETCETSMGELQLLKALAGPDSDFSPLFSRVIKVLCRVYMMGTAKPNTVGSAGGTLLDGDATPLPSSGGAGGAPPPAVYLYVDTTAAREHAAARAVGGAGAGAAAEGDGGLARNKIDAALAAMATLSAKVVDISAKVADIKKNNDFMRFRDAFARPVSHVSSSDSSVLTPTSKAARHALKIATIDFYDLWATAEADASSRKVYTMLPTSGDAEAGREAVAFEDAILSHIWQQSRETGTIVRVLSLPRDFNTSPRNFLILPKRAEEAFDLGALLFLPSAGSTVTTRRTAYVPQHLTAEELDAMAGRTLFLPKAHEGRVPFMRLLGWTVLSYLSEPYEGGKEEWAEPATEMARDDTITTRHAGILMSHRDDMRRTGLLFKSVLTKPAAADAGSPALGAGAADPAAAIPAAVAPAAGPEKAVAAGTGRGKSVATAAAAGLAEPAEADDRVAAASAALTSWTTAGK